MCGRYVVVSKLKAIEQRFRAMFVQPEFFSASPNISLGDYAPVIANDFPDQIRHMQFGLTPFWAKKRSYFFNARAEGDHNKENDPMYRGPLGIIKKPSFRSSIRYKRCLILADGFIEGPMKEKLDKPFVIYRRDSKPFAFAGIWDDWTDQDTGEIVQSFAIITTVANTLLRKIGHHRSPVILDEAQESQWLQGIELNEVLSMLTPCPTETFNAYPINASIKNPKNKDIQLLQPAGARIYPEYEYEIHQELRLEGMGMTSARKRKLNSDDSQLKLF